MKLVSFTPLHSPPQKQRKSALAVRQPYQQKKNVWSHSATYGHSRNWRRRI